LDVPRSSVLRERKPPRDLSRIKIAIEHMRVIFPTAGFVLMYQLLRRHRVLCTRAEVRRAYSELGYLRKRPPRRSRTTDSRHEHERFPNLVRNLRVERPDEVWVADTTEFKVLGKTTYLALVEDMFTRRVVGFALSHSNNSQLTSEAMEMALRLGTPEIHHTDQGKTYASDRYTRRLFSLGVLLSMAAAGCAWENGYAERLNRTFKEEEILLSEYQSLAEARASIAAYVTIYNEARLHKSLAYKTPNEVNDAHRRQAS
jgi:transposase InsO family protein